MNRLKETWWEKICYANRNHRNAELDILIPDQIGFKTKSVTRHEEVYFTVIKSLTIRERYHNNMRFIVEPWNTWSKNKQNWETDNSTTAVKDFIMPLGNNRTTQKTSKETEDLRSIAPHTCRTLHLATAEQSSSMQLECCPVLTMCLAVSQASVHLRRRGSCKVCSANMVGWN